MLPIVFDPATIAVGLAGAGEGWARRKAMLAEAGVSSLTIAPDAPQNAISA